MQKYIHYCWFGGKPLPKLAKKCIKSWKKYLPDYKIIKWSEENVDLNECDFIKQAYESKKWAFVADYARTKALNEMGGIYFDTDMEVTKNIDNLLKNDTFLGMEDSGMIAVGVWYEKEKNSFLSTKLLDYYKNCGGFDAENAYTYAIPKIITDLIDDDKFVMSKNEIQHLKHDIVIYPREYFYPLSYDRSNNIFTDNTCMIHYYDASWVPKYEKKINRINKIFGNKIGGSIINSEEFFKRQLLRVYKILLYPLYAHKRNKKVKEQYLIDKNDIDEQLKNIKGNDVITIYRKDWLGTSYATKEMFENVIGISKTENPNTADYYAHEIINKKPKLIIFSAFDLSWNELIKRIKDINQNQRIKILWHGSNAMNVEKYDWETLKTILQYSKYGLIDSIGFVKKTMYEFYKTKNIKCEFVMNTLSVNKKDYVDKTEKSNKVRIGLYSSGDRWVKNYYNQLSAASMIDNHLIDCVPKSEKTVEFANMIGANIIGEVRPIKREVLLKRMSKNDINIYVTFVECAPLLPIESLELGVPCITANNHHYWEGTELEKYLIVNAPDNIIEIKNKIEYVLKNKDKIISLYKTWKKDYDKKAKKSVKDFINN